MSSIGSQASNPSTQASNTVNPSVSNEVERFRIIGTPKFAVDGEFEIENYDLPRMTEGFFPMNRDVLVDADLESIDLDHVMKYYAEQICLSIKHSFEVTLPMPVLKSISKKFKKQYPNAETNFQRMKLNPTKFPLASKFRNIGDLMMDKLTLWKEGADMQKKRDYITGKSNKPWPYRKGKAFNKLTEKLEEKRRQFLAQNAAKKAEKRSAGVKLAEAERTIAKLNKEKADLALQLEKANQKYTESDEAESWRMNSFDTNAESNGETGDSNNETLVSQTNDPPIIQVAPTSRMTTRSKKA